MKLLEDIVVLDLSQFLSGPSASLRLADMGARVIKIERPGTGDICRELYVSDIILEGESTIFHAINRNKESYTANLKRKEDLDKVKQMIGKADVMMHNFRPGVIDRLGLDYETVKALNPAIVYAEIDGYTNAGPWEHLPGQDLLLQAASGLTWLSGNQQDPPVPMGVAVVDILAGTHLAQGILAALYRRVISGEGSLVQVSMLESVLDFQFELLTCFYNDERRNPVRSAVNNGNVYIPAPYGIYKTTDGYLALAMASIITLGELLDCAPLLAFTDPGSWYTRRDEIKALLAAHLAGGTTAYWLGLLEPADIWCAPVMDYDRLMKEEGYQVLNMEQVVRTGSGLSVKTTRCPLRIDGALLFSAQGAPMLGEHNEKIEKEFGIR